MEKSGSPTEPVVNFYVFASLSRSMAQLRTLLDSAYNTAKQGYYKDALDEFRLILNHDPEQKEALYGAAACAFPTRGASASSSRASSRNANRAATASRSAASSARAINNELTAPTVHAFR